MSTVVAKPMKNKESNTNNQDLEVDFVALIKRTRAKIPFWRFYQDFLASQKNGEFDQFISASPQPRTGE